MPPPPSSLPARSAPHRPPHPWWPPSCAASAVHGSAGQHQGQGAAAAALITTQRWQPNHPCLSCVAEPKGCLQQVAPTHPPTHPPTHLAGPLLPQVILSVGRHLAVEVGALRLGCQGPLEDVGAADDAAAADGGAWGGIRGWVGWEGSVVWRDSLPGDGVRNGRSRGSGQERPLWGHHSSVPFPLTPRACPGRPRQAGGGSSWPA